jgi:hypothetical protein
VAGVFAETFKRAVAVMRAMLIKERRTVMEQKGRDIHSLYRSASARREARRIARDEG